MSKVNGDNDELLFASDQDQDELSLDLEEEDIDDGSLSSFNSYQDDDDDSDFDEKRRRQKGNFKRGLFDDVKVILRKHDKKLLKMEDEMNFIVRWLNEKFGFVLKNGSLSSIVSVLDDDELPSRSSEGSDNDGLHDDDVGALDEGSFDVFVENRTVNEARSINKSLPVENNYAKEEDDDDYDVVDSGRLSIIPSKADTNANTKPLKDSSKEFTSSSRPKPLKTKRHRNNIKGSSSQSQQPSSHIPLGPSQCDACGKFLKDPNSLRQHKQIHLDSRPFLCPEPQCGKSFKRKFHLQTHSLIHVGVKKHQCGYCGRLFLLQKDLVCHERLHTGEKPFRCPECPKSFNLKSHLVMHSRTHSGEKPYVCDICSKSFSQSNSLRLHKKNLHKKPLDNEIIPPPSKKHLSKRKKPSVNKSQFTAFSTHPISVSSPIPNKLPLYRNQGKFLTSPVKLAIPPSSSQVLTIFQEPALPLPFLSVTSRPIEIINQPFTATATFANNNATPDTPSGGVEPIFLPLINSSASELSPSCTVPIPTINILPAGSSEATEIAAGSLINPEIIDLTETE